MRAGDPKEEKNCEEILRHQMVDDRRPEGGEGLPGFDCLAVRGEPCTIRLAFGLGEGEYRLRVSDNGIGLPPGTDPAAGRSLGLRLIHFLARHQLRATVQVTSGSGTAYCIRFPAAGPDTQPRDFP